MRHQGSPPGTRPCVSSVHPPPRPLARSLIFGCCCTSWFLEHSQGAPGRPEHAEHQRPRHPAGGDHHLPHLCRGGDRACLERDHQGRLRLGRPKKRQVIDCCDTLGWLCQLLPLRLSLPHSRGVQRRFAAHPDANIQSNPEASHSILLVSSLGIDRSVSVGFREGIPRAFVVCYCVHRATLAELVGKLWPSCCCPITCAFSRWRRRTSLLSIEGCWFVKPLCLGVCPVERTGRAGVWNALETPRFPRAWSSCLSANGEYARGGGGGGSGGGVYACARVRCSKSMGRSACLCGICASALQQ